MLSGITSYLFGGAVDEAPAVDQTAEAAASKDQTANELGLQTVNADEEWVLVDRVNKGDLAMKNTTTHPLENLLIEHPSMSVYAMRGRPHSTGADSEGSESSTNTNHQTNQIPRHNTRQTRARPTTSASVQASLQASNQQLALRSMQRVAKRHQRVHLSHHNMERNNRVRLTNSRGNHTLRRKDRMLRPSGANNNRKLH